MKALSILSVLAISFGITACVGEPGGADLDSDLNDTDDSAEETGESQDPLTVTTFMGNAPWAHQTPFTTDLVLAHRALGVYNKLGEVASGADFPTIEGLAATTANINTCKDSYMDVYVYKRPSGSSSWTQIDHQKRFAKATVSGGVITSCDVTFETPYCSPYAFGGFDADMEVDVIAIGGNGQQGRKVNIIRNPIVNLANCN